MIDIELDSLIRASEKGYRVDVVGLAKKLDIPVYSVDLPNDESGHIYDGDRPYIEVNCNHPITRQRFTIAHEVSHYLMHHDLLKAKGRLDNKSEFNTPEEAAIEASADERAAEILMPKELVDSYFHEHQWDNLTRLNSAMITQIASEFRVSHAMAVTRLRGLGIAISFLSFA